MGILVGLAGGLHPFLSFASLLGGLGWSWNTTCCHVCAEKGSDLLHVLHLWEMGTIGTPVERMHPYWCQGCAHMEFDSPHGAQRRGSTWVEHKRMARKSLSPPCRPPGLGCPPGHSVPQEKSATASQVALVPPDEKKFPSCASHPAPLATAATGKPQLQFLLISKPPKLCPCTLDPTQLSSVTFLAKGGPVGKKSTLSQTSKAALRHFL